MPRKDAAEVTQGTTGSTSRRDNKSTSTTTSATSGAELTNQSSAAPFAVVSPDQLHSYDAHGGGGSPPRVPDLPGGTGTTSKRTKAVSCRECIRTKLKCSREPWPCDKCTERGIPHLCPGQQLRTRPYKRQRLTRKQDGLEQGSEDATTASPEVSIDQDDSVAGAKSNAVQQPSERQKQKQKQKQSAPSSSVRGSGGTSRSSEDAPTASTPSSSSLQHRGMLMFDKSGTSNYYGPGSHSFLLAGNALPSDGKYSRVGSPEQAQRESTYNDAESSSMALIRTRILDDPSSFLAIPGVRSPFGVRPLVEQLCAYLPSLATARRAFRIYRYNVSWMYDPIASLDELWNDFYGDSAHRSHLLHPHRVSLIFSVLSLGVLFDVGRPEHHTAERYYHWSWAALQLSNPGDANTLEHVQTIHLVGQYLCNRKNGKHADSFFPLMGTAMRSAISLGLHREGTAWNLAPAELEDRRRLFWELYASDCFRSLAYGRPCSIQDSHVDAQFPSCRADSGLSDVFHTVKFQVVRLLNRILDVAQRPDVAYSTVLDFDRELRELWVRLPPELNPLPSGGHATSWNLDLDRVARQHQDDDNNDDDEASMRALHLFLQGHTIVININQSILHLHRPWFVRALEQDRRPSITTSASNRNSARDRAAPSSPPPASDVDRDAFDSRFARSIVAVSESSRSLIHSSQAILDRVPTLGGAWNYFWQHCFNAGVCQCLQMLHNPSSMTTFGAWDDVRRALSILKRARPDEGDVVWAGKIDLLEQLQARAEATLREVSASRRPLSTMDRARARKTKSNRDHGDGDGEEENEEREIERDPMLRLVGVTSRIDRRRGRHGHAGATASSSAGTRSSPHLTNTNTNADDITPMPWLQHTTDAPPLPTFTDGTITDAIPSSSSSSSSIDLIPALSHSLIDSWLTSGGVSGGDNALSPTPSAPASAPAPAPTAPSQYPPIPPDNSQFDRLLTELLAGGSEPDVGFWESIFGGGVNGQQQQQHQQNA